MPDHDRNPNSRMPKSERNPKLRKPEVRRQPEIFLDDDSDISEADFWQSGAADHEALHDGAPARLPVRDLCERTAQFGEKIIGFAKKIPQDAVTSRLISQLVGAGTSVGANYCEADDAVSKKDFKKSVGTCRKESKETKFWLRMVATAEPSLKAEARVLWQEAKELNLIFGSIWRKP